MDKINPPKRRLPTFRRLLLPVPAKLSKLEIMDLAAQAFGTVARVKGMTGVAKECLNQENLYRSLSEGGNAARRTLKIRSEAVDLPVAVARWLRAVAALDFLWRFGARSIAFGAPGGGFGERALGFGRQVTPARRYR